MDTAEASRRRSADAAKAKLVHFLLPIPYEQGGFVKYTEAQFFALIDAVEADGGEYVSDAVHTKRQWQPDKHNPPAVLGCGKPSLFNVRISEDECMTFCATCDSLGAWPRFGGRLPL
jgi:hypothetical protein